MRIHYTKILERERELFQSRAFRVFSERVKIWTFLLTLATVFLEEPLGLNWFPPRERELSQSRAYISEFSLKNEKPRLLLVWWGQDKHNVLGNTSYHFLVYGCDELHRKNWGRKTKMLEADIFGNSLPSRLKNLVNVFSSQLKPSKQDRSHRINNGLKILCY